jgi:hypothetical protein
MNGTKQIKKDEGRRMKSQIRDQRAEDGDQMAEM